MPRPSTLPAPWGDLAAAHGGVGKLAAALGVAPSTIHRWAHGKINPSGPAKILIEHMLKSLKTDSHDQA